MNSMYRLFYPVPPTSVHYLVFLRTIMPAREETIIYINNACVLGFKNILFYMFISDDMYLHHVQWRSLQCHVQWRRGIRSLRTGIPIWLGDTKWKLGTEPRSSVSEETTFSHWAMSVLHWLNFDGCLEGKTISSGVGIGREMYKN